MQFHPDKCEVISITRKENPIITNYTLHGHQLQHVNSVKYLGLTVSNDLCWDKHVDQVVAKANNTLSVLRRNLNIHNPKVKAHTDHLTKKLEMVQRRAARFTLNKYRHTDSVTAMLETLSWPTLSQRRLHARLSMLFKIHHNLVAIDTSHILSSKQHNTPTRTENTLAYHIPQSRTEYHRNSFYPRTIRVVLTYFSHAHSQIEIACRTVVYIATSFVDSTQ